MSLSVVNRVVRAEKELMVGEDQQQLLKTMRFIYNTPLVPYEALLVKILSLAGGFEPPAWAVAEFERPLQGDIEPKKLAGLRRRAANLLRSGSAESKTKPKNIPNLEKEIRECMERLSQYAGERIEDLQDVAVWCASPGGRDYEPVGCLALAIARREEREAAAGTA